MRGADDCKVAGVRSRVTGCEMTRMVLPSGRTSRIAAIDTFDGELDEAYPPLSVTLRLEDDIDVSRGDMIVSLDAQPMTGLEFEAQIVALQPDGIEPGKRYWLKSGSRRQRVQVQPVQQLDLKAGKWQAAEMLQMNAIGKVHLSFDETAIFDPYELNRGTGAFILIDPDTNNTVAGGMITAKRTEFGGLNAHEGRVILSLPADLAEQLLATELLASRRDEVETRRVTTSAARQLLDDIDG